MPELPEVETYRRYLNRFVIDKKISSLSSIDSFLLKDKMDPVQLSSTLAGRKINKITRHGKYLFLEVQGPKYLILHFGMTGRPEFLKDCRNAPGHIRLLIGFDDSCMALVDTRRLGMIYLYDDMDNFLADKKLGPDALSIGFDTFTERLSKRSKPVKSALLDQSIIAGIGNLYADEILFQSSIHPLSRCTNIDRKSYMIMHRKLRQVLEKAVSTGADMDNYPESWLLSHREKTAACPHCGGMIAIIKVGGRTTYFCPRTQKISI